MIDIQYESRKRGLAPRVLITRLRYLGDVVISTALIQLLSEKAPELELFYLAEEPYSSILELDPRLKGVVTIGDGLREVYKVVKRLRELKITAVIDLFYNPKSAWVSYLSGAPIRIGGSRRWRKRFYTHNFVVPENCKSAIMHHVHALVPIGFKPEERMPEIFLSADEMKEGREILENLGGGGRGFVAVHPGGKWQAKRWSEEGYARLIELIVRELGMDVLILTGPGEEVISGSVKESSAAGYLMPPMPIRKVASVLASCSALVASDGGIMHLSVGLGVPTVALLGPTDPQIWFPYEGKGPYRYVHLDKPCSPCDRHFCEDRSCMDEIEPGYVVEKLVEVING